MWLKKKCHKSIDTVNIKTTLNTLQLFKVDVFATCKSYYSYKETSTFVFECLFKFSCYVDCSSHASKFREAKNMTSKLCRINLQRKLSLNSKQTRLKAMVYPQLTFYVRTYCSLGHGCNFLTNYNLFTPSNSRLVLQTQTTGALCLDDCTEVTFLVKQTLCTTYQLLKSSSGKTNYLSHTIDAIL